MAEEQEVRQLELLCKQLYESQNPANRAEAEKALVGFQNAPDTLSKCQLLLERGDSCYAQLLAATTLTRLVSRNAQGLSLQQRIDIRNYVLNYLATQPKLPNFVIQALVTLFAKITKLGWFDYGKDDFVFRNVVHDTAKFLQGSVEHCMIGVQLLSHLVCEMNQISEADANRSLTKHRKIAASFRDMQLYEIFELACSLLTTARENCKNLNFNDEAQHGLMTHLLRLAHNCLTFDFIGTSTDESSDDLCTVQIPGSWRPAFLDFSTLKLFFDLYHSLPGTLSPLALSCLVQIASVRRSAFSNAERGKFLTHLVNGVKHILENPQGLSDPSNYHEFCRLLARLKSNYQLGELVTVENYPEAIRLVAKFTVESLQMWQFAPNSVHYLLSLWQRMVASVPYVKVMEPHLLEIYTPEVTKAYITSRLESVTVVVREGIEDPLDDLGMVQQQLEQLSVIGRCEYQKTCTLLVQLLDQTARAYQEALATSSSPSMKLNIQEGRLTWLVYIIGSAIGGRVSFNNNEELDAMDGELVCRVLQLLALTDSGLGQGGCEKLELAMLSFFEQFRKIYVGDQIQKNSKVYRRLSEVLGLSDESMVLSVFIRKIITNLKYWGRSEQIISKTLQLLNDLSTGYSCVRKLVKLDEVQFMLNNHTSEYFSFLRNNVAVAEMRCRSMFYTSLGRLLMVDLGEDEERFQNFMLPLTATFESLGTMLASAETPLFAAEEAKKALIGLARDLRGLAYAFNTKNSYIMLFDWVYPNYTPILLHAMELWYHDPQVTTPVLKLFAELVLNRSQRLQFDVSSPNGILLFREASKVICSYGRHILNVEVSKEQIYPLKLKGISICFSMLKAALCGNYVNFGVFRLYGDEALDNALNTFVKLLLSIPQSDLLDYPKLSQTYYVLLECLAQDHMGFLSTLEPPVFLYILSSISEGLTSLGGNISFFADTMVCTGCCSTLDYIVTYHFKQLTMKGKKTQRGMPAANDMFLQVLELHPEILQQILSTVLNVIMFEDCKNQWSMSRPLLGLILLNEEYFNGLREQIIRSQPVDKQASMLQWFENLMDGIERNLLTKNRDRFTQNLSKFRRDINDSLKVVEGAGRKETDEGKLVCPGLVNPRRGIVTCHYRGSGVSCLEVSAGTVADYECETDFRADPVRIIECSEDGTWNSPIPVCVPDCGRQKSAVSLVMNGALPAPGMYPWHAAVYNFLDGRFEFWCGGSLISEFSVLTAAHCTWKVPTGNLFVAFGKIMRDFHAVENNAQKRKVVRVEMVRSYQDVGGNYNGDLSVMFLERAVTINEMVRPICIDWNQKYMEEQLFRGNLGVVLGWGLTENDTFSDVVKSVRLPVESDENCIAQQHKDFRKFITYTSFCAGFRNGSGVCNGDSGGGLAFLDPKSDSWFLQGVVSVSPRRKGSFFCDPNFYTVFTKVSIFTKWLAKMKKLEQILIKSGLIFFDYH